MKTAQLSLHKHTNYLAPRIFSPIKLKSIFLLIICFTLLFFPCIYILRIVLQLLNVILNLFNIKTHIVVFPVLCKTQIYFDLFPCFFFFFFSFTSIKLQTHDKTCSIIENTWFLLAQQTEKKQNAWKNHVYVNLTELQLLVRFFSHNIKQLLILAHYFH